MLNDWTISQEFMCNYCEKYFPVKDMCNSESNRAMCPKCWTKQQALLLLIWTAIMVPIALFFVFAISTGQ